MKYAIITIPVFAFALSGCVVLPPVDESEAEFVTVEPQVLSSRVSDFQGDDERADGRGPSQSAASEQEPESAPEEEGGDFGDGYDDPESWT